MSFEVFLSKMQNLGIQFEIRGDDLHFKAPPGAISIEVWAELKKNRSLILNHLQARSNESNDSAARELNTQRGNIRGSAANQTISKEEMQNVTEVFTKLRQWDKPKPP